jgi:glycosyltransferase involved in cell wall biosynthesis
MSPSKAPKRLAFIGGYEPRRCGIATFTHDLCEAVSTEQPLTECYACAVNDTPAGYDYSKRVRWQFEQKDLKSYRKAADALNFDNVEGVFLQHEFGIYGGPAGSHILALLKEVRMPVITTLHTVLKDPSLTQYQVVKGLVERSDRLVVMANKGAQLLRDVYGVSSKKIDVIPHGIPDIPFADSENSKAQFGVEGRQVLFTFGLLGPGKGIEQVLKALPAITKRHPKVVYLIVGATHPHLIAEEGESYRFSLKRMVEDLGLKKHVIFYNQFVSIDDLKEFIGATDIYLTPYLNEAQITSGTLAYVFGAGKAVVSTPYWHAHELLAEDRGILVPFNDPPAIAAAVCTYLENPERFNQTRRAAYDLGRDMIWPAVADQYMQSFERAKADRIINPRAAFADWTLDSRPYALPPLKLDHLEHMSDGTGIFQHAVFDVPNYHEGYCVDDNARAFILFTLLPGLGEQPAEKKCHHFASNYLAFIVAAFNPDKGRFRNFMSHGRQWLDAVGSEDSHGRALWAMGVGTHRSNWEGHSQLCRQTFEQSLSAVHAFTSPRAWAFSLLGIYDYLQAFPDNNEALEASQALTQKLTDAWEKCSSNDWLWFEKSVTYENARLCQAMLLIGRTTPNQAALDSGLQSLRWLVYLQKTDAGHYRPIGSNGFYKKGGTRAAFDQQPVEAQAMVSACLEAFRATQDAAWLDEAKRAFEWFLGRNDLGLSLYDSKTGGCRDGLHPDRMNQNQGAESSLGFYLALADMDYAEQLLTHPTLTLS